MTCCADASGTSDDCSRTGSRSPAGNVCIVGTVGSQDMLVPPQNLATVIQIHAGHLKTVSIQPADTMTTEDRSSEASQPDPGAENF